MNKYTENDLQSRILEAWKNLPPDLEQIRTLVKTSHAESPQYFEEHREDVGCEPINNVQRAWDNVYYSSQKFSLEYNFSYERAMHLIEVYQYLANERILGFPLPRSQSTSRGNNIMPDNEPVHSSYTPGQNLIDTVKSGSVHHIRAALMAELESNQLAISAIRQAMQWVIKEGISELFTDYQENSLAQGFADKTQWNEDYYHLQTAYLNANFSQKRFEHLLEVYQHLRDQGVSGFAFKPRQQTTPRASNTNQQPRHQPHTPGSSRPRQSQPSGAKPDSSLLKIAMIAGGGFIVLALLILAVRS